MVYLGVCFHDFSESRFQASMNRRQVKRHWFSHHQGLRFDQPGHRLEAEVPPSNLPFVGDPQQHGSHEAYHRASVGLKALALPGKDPHHIGSVIVCPYCDLAVTYGKHTMAFSASRICTTS